MQRIRLLLSAAIIASACASANAIEGPTAAGPIGGTDIRSALLPPPGTYGGLLLVPAKAFSFVDGKGNTIPELSTAHLTKRLAGPFFIYVLDVKVLGGSIGMAGVFPFGDNCGHLFANTPDNCSSGLGDPYVEIAWSRFFGKMRPSRFSGALPIPEGLATLVGIGIVFPIGQYDATDLTTQALSIGTNIWDFSPTVAVTYTTPPILVEGTEFSAKFYWNNYLTNPDTDYLSGTVLGLDFAVTERIGRFQLGLAGTYAVQVADDKQFGIKVPPDGRRAEQVNLGGVINYDIPKHSAAVRVKAFTSVMAKNTVWSSTLVLGWIKKF